MYASNEVSPIDSVIAERSVSLIDGVLMEMSTVSTAYTCKLATVSYLFDIW